MQRGRIVVIGVLMTLAISGVNARAQKPEKLAVGYGSISTNYLPLWMAKEAGIFRKNGLDPEIFVDPRFIQELDSNGFIDGLYKPR